MSRSVSSVSSKNRLMAQATRKKLDVLQSAKDKNTEKLSETSSITYFASVGKSSLKLSMVQLQTQLAIVESIERQDDGQNGDMLFALMDEDQNGKILADDVYNFIRGMHTGKPYAHHVNGALDIVRAQADRKLTGYLEAPKFRKLLAHICLELKISFQDLVESILVGFFRAKNGLEDGSTAASTAPDPVDSFVVETVDYPPEEEEAEPLVPEEEPLNDGIVYDNYEEEPLPEEPLPEDDGIVYDNNFDYNDLLQAQDDGIVYDNQDDVPPPPPPVEEEPYEEPYEEALPPPPVDNNGWEANNGIPAWSIPDEGNDEIPDEKPSKEMEDAEPNTVSHVFVTGKNMWV
mmetsp:Transcript_244/g.314  ORF Transcript_244/g.314 Transcript_244/m.314 type:complete len:346 (+) Transcript_244:118-1155(+)